MNNAVFRASTCLKGVCIDRNAFVCNYMKMVYFLYFFDLFILIQTNDEIKWKKMLFYHLLLARTSTFIVFIESKHT